MEKIAFKLPTGVECEITELLGEHQKQFTSAKNKGNYTNGLITMLSNVVTRLGSNTNITKSDIEQLLEYDTSKILIELRKLSFEDVFQFKYKFDLGNGKKTQPYPVSADLSEIKVEPYKKMNEKGELVPMDCKEYKEVLEASKIGLAMPNKEIIFIKLPNNISPRPKENEASILSKITMLQPSYLLGDNTKDISKEIQFTSEQLEKMSAKKLGHIAKETQKFLGFVDCFVEMPNPEMEEQTETINLLAISDFLLPGYL